MMKKLWYLCLYTKLFKPMAIYQKLIDMFIFCKKKLTFLTLNYQINAIYNFCQNISRTPYILNHMVNHGLEGTTRFLVKNCQLAM